MTSETEWAWYRKMPLSVMAKRLTRSRKIKTLEGILTAKKGDWLVRGITGELYPVRDDIFRATYRGSHEPMERP